MLNHRAVWMAAAAFAAAFGGVVAAPAQQSDKTKAALASARITQPAEGAVLKGIVTLKADLQRSDRHLIIGSMAFYAGEQKVAEVCPGAPQAKWDTRQVPDGPCALTVRLWDFDRKTRKAANLIHVSKPVRVTVRNCEH